jgi:signal transduction protein with GAF and PtsI domain
VTDLQGLPFTAITNFPPLLNMIEPLTAFALAGNIVQFVEVAYKATVILRQIWDASATDENLEIEAIAQDVTDISAKLITTSSSASAISQDEEKLQQLARRCEDPAGELTKMLQDLVVRSKGMKRRIEAVHKTLEQMYRREKIESLQRRIRDLRDQISARMIFILQ